MKVFIDGSNGTTGLRLYDRLKQRTDITLFTLSEELRKDDDARKEALFDSDIAFLCLPDDAARQAVMMAENSKVRIIDASTAHRTDSRFCYGFPELSKAHEEAIGNGNRIAVPGCHASGYIALMYPLIACGLIPADYPAFCYSLTGYSGGGKAMIREYESENRSGELDSPRLYALTQQHKHLKEMAYVTKSAPPIFSPCVGDFYCGMLVSVPLFPKFLTMSVKLSDIKHIYEEAYGGKPYMKITDCDGMITANALAGSDIMEIIVTGNDERMVLNARYDNLGKGASGAAIQCMDIMIKG